MTFLPDVIVSFWMLPVVVFIVLPLAIFVVYSGNRLLRKILGTERTVAEPMPSISRRRTKEAV
jgi:hypothetical protein